MPTTSELGTDVQNAIWHSWIGKRVRKITGKPFKSTFKINTVIGVCVHEHRPVLAFRFKEDASHVSCETCVLVPEEQSVPNADGTVQ